MLRYLERFSDKNFYAQTQVNKLKIKSSFGIFSKERQVLTIHKDDQSVKFYNSLL